MNPYLRRGLTFIALLVGLFALFPRPGSQIIIFLKPWPFFFSLVPMLSVLLSDGFIPLKEALTGSNIEVRARLQKRIVVFGFVTFLAAASVILHSLDDTNSIGPNVMRWMSLALFLGLQSWILS